MFKKILILAFLSTSAFANEVRVITPPKLELTNIGEKILCHRPMRTGSPKMSVEELDGKFIVHNYGHGGSGWTLAPGSVEYVREQLLSKTTVKKDEPITIIGGGVLGLFTAYDLLKNNYTNITIVADKFDAITSHNAGGLIAPVSMDNDPEMQKIVDGIGIKAYSFYADVASGKIKEFNGGAVIVPTYFDNRELSGLEPYVNKVMKPAKDVTVDFGKSQRKMVVYDDGIFVQTPFMMDKLTSFLKTNKVNFVTKHVNNFSEIGSKVIFNCTGLGSKDLVKDADMVSVQGHLIMLKDQNPKDLAYMMLIYLDDGVTESGQKIKRSFYIFPKQLANSQKQDIGVLGGTFIQGADSSTPNTKEFDGILATAKSIYGIGK